MKGLTKKIMAGTLAASLVLGSSLVAFAEDDPAAATPKGTGTAGGAGEVEGIVETDVYNAVFPTNNANAYKYIADPQGLIRKTEAAKYSGATFGEGTVFFKNVSGDTTSYSNTSDAITITNKSSKNLSVKVTATATAGTEEGAATLATDKTFASDDTDLKVYLGITDSVTGSTETALAETPGVEITAVLGAAPEDAYEYKYDETDGYSYGLKSDVSAFTFADYSFQINGAANANAKWAADTAVPEISVKWDVDLTDADATVATPEQVVNAAPSMATTSYEYDKSADLRMAVSLGSGDLKATGVAKLQYSTAADGTYTDLLKDTKWSYSDGTITFNLGQFGSTQSGDVRYLKAIFDDTAATPVVITITIK